LFEPLQKLSSFLLSFFMTNIITISSHIWCIRLVVLFRNFATLNLPLSQLFKCKLSSILEILEMISTCDIEIGTETKTTTFCGSSLWALRLTTCAYFTLSRSIHFSNWKHHSICGVASCNFVFLKLGLGKLFMLDYLIMFPLALEYPTYLPPCLASRLWHLHSCTPRHTPIFPQGFWWRGGYEDHYNMDNRIVWIVEK